MTIGRQMQGVLRSQWIVNIFMIDMCRFRVSAIAFIMHPNKKSEIFARTGDTCRFRRCRTEDYYKNRSNRSSSTHQIPPFRVERAGGDTKIRETLSILTYHIKKENYSHA